MKLNKPQLCLDFFNKSFFTKQHNSSWYFQRNTMKQICNIISLNISNNAFIHELSILCYEQKNFSIKKCRSKENQLLVNKKHNTNFNL